MADVEQQDGGDEVQVPEKTPEEIMKEQEAKLVAKYGGMKPKKKAGPLGGAKEHKFFDSADWAMAKEGASKQGGSAAGGAPAPPPAVVEAEKLKPKLEPTPLPARRISHLDPLAADK